MHSPRELGDLKDVNATQDLLSHFLCTPPPQELKEKEEQKP